MTHQQYGAEQYAAPTATYASWIQRVGAFVIDAIIIAPFAILAATLGMSPDPTTDIPTPNTMYYVFVLLQLVVNGYNRWFQAGKTGQSWGKKAVGIRLVNEATGQPIGAGMAFVRDLAHIIDSITCLIGYLWPLWDAKKQTLADKIVKTVVVK